MLGVVALLLVMVMAVMPVANVEAKVISELNVNASNIASESFKAGATIDKAEFRGGAVPDKDDGVKRSSVRFTLIKRAPSKAELDAYVNGSGTNDWMYDDSAFPVTVQPDTEYYVLTKFFVAGPEHQYKDGTTINFNGALDSATLGIYSVNSTNDTIYGWYKIKSGSADSPVTPDPNNNSNNANQQTDVTNADTSSASNTDATATKASTAKSTTTKASTPKTADAVPVVGFALVLAGVAAAGVVVYRRRIH